MKLVLLTGLLSVLLFGCEEEKLDGGPLIGSWALSRYEDNVAVMERVPSLDDDKYGFVFLSNGKFVEHKNAGWCGTPPIAYDNFEGNWAKNADSLININVAYWGGSTSYSMEIVSLDHGTLKYIRRL